MGVTHFILLFMIHEFLSNAEWQIISCDFTDCHS